MDLASNKHCRCLCDGRRFGSSARQMHQARIGDLDQYSNVAAATLTCARQHASGRAVEEARQMATAELQVVSGTVIACRLFDIADSIDLAKAETIWSRQAHPTGTPPPGSRGRLVSTPAKAVSFGVPPFDVSLDPVALRLDGAEIWAEATARLYDFGVTR